MLSVVGGSGGMLPKKILTYGLCESASEAVGGHEAVVHIEMCAASE